MRPFDQLLVIHFSIMPTNTSFQVAVIGPAELVSGLQAIGLDMFPATDSETAVAALTQIRSSATPYACVCITEGVAATLTPEQLSGGKAAASLPVILTIPDLHSDKDAGLAKLRELTKRAVGIDIIG